MPRAEGQTEGHYRLGVDIGGTFTDVVLVDERTGAILVAKVPTVPADPSDGFLNGIEKAFSKFAIAPEAIRFLVHATTIATNTIIQGKGAAAGLLTTAGFRDVLEIAYQTRPSLYDVFYDKPKPLVPRYRCLGVRERLGPGGQVLIPLDEDDVVRVGREFAQQAVEAIAVAFLHSYDNPQHERRVAAILREICPNIPVVLSSEVCPEFREYQRTSTTVVNAVLLPRIGPYISSLERRLGNRGVRAPLHLMTSGGGITSASTAARYPVTLIESGPAAGVIGAAYVGALAGYDRILSLDIGGTTAKVALVTGGRPMIASEFEVGGVARPGGTVARGQGYPVKTPVVSLVEIGAGGGSIALIDPGGALSVGPESAGAVPGPACYDQGGDAATVTDAHVALGHIDPDYFLGGDQRISRECAERAIRTSVAGPLALSVPAAARAVVEIADTKMISSLRFVTIEKGIDPRDYVLVVSGGAGPLHAVALARGIGVRKVVVPPSPGLNSAVGLLATDLKHDFVRTYMRRTEHADLDAIQRIFSEMEASGQAMLSEAGVARDDVRLRYELDICYVGQSFSFRIPMADPGSTSAPIDEVVSRFHEAHREAYGFSNPAEPTQIVNLRLTATGEVERPRLRTLARRDPPAPAPRKGVRAVYVHGVGGEVEHAVYERSGLMAGDRVSGPAIVEQMDTTTLIPADATAWVDQYGIITVDLPAQ